MGNTEMERVTFFRSYFDVEQQLSSKRDRLAFLEAILFYAFEGRVPEKLLRRDEALGGRIYERARGYVLQAPQGNRRLESK